MQTIGHEIATRYDRISVKERIIAEIKRRLDTKDWSFSTVNWGRIQRFALPDDYDGKAGPVLCILDGEESFGGNAQTYQNTVSITFEYAVKPGVNEEPSTLLNLIMAELVEVFGKNHRLREGGEDSDGEYLSCSLVPRSYEPDIIEGEPTVRGLLYFELIYRVRTHDMYTPVGN